MAAGNDPGGREIQGEVIEVVVRRAQIDRQLETRIHRHVLRHGDKNTIGVRGPSIVAGMRAPGRLPDDVALGAHGRLGEVDDAGAIDHGKEMPVAVKDALEVISQAQVVETERLQPVNHAGQIIEGECLLAVGKRFGKGGGGEMHGRKE